MQGEADVGGGDDEEADEKTEGKEDEDAHANHDGVDCDTGSIPVWNDSHFHWKAGQSATEAAEAAEAAEVEAVAAVGVCQQHSGQCLQVKLCRFASAC